MTLRGQVGPFSNRVAEKNLDTFKKVVEINLVGTFNVSRLTAARIVRDLPKPIKKPDAKTPDRGIMSV